MTAERVEFHYEVLYDPFTQSEEYAKAAGPVGRSFRLTLTALLVRVFGPFYLDLNDSIVGFECPSIGVPNNPELPLPPDDIVFATCKSVSDFDRSSLWRDRLRAEQFLRWKSKVLEEALARPLAIGDIVTAETDGYSSCFMASINPHPLIPLPSETEDYLTSTLRARPKELPHLISDSKSFKLRITRLLKTVEDGTTDFEAIDIATVYKCRLLSVDDIPITTDIPSLCLKIVDDRLMRLRPIDEAEVKRQGLRFFLRYALASEDLIRPEDAAYRRLEHAQGSVVPYYYGSHLVSWFL